MAKSAPVWIVSLLYCPNGLDDEFGVVEWDSKTYKPEEFGDPLAALKALLENDLCSDDRIRICLGWPNMRIFYGYPAPAVKWVLEQAEHLL